MAKALASAASSRRVIRSSSACRAVAHSAWLIGAGRRLSASACCSRSATRRPSALTCASCALLWVCSASRDRMVLIVQHEKEAAALRLYHIGEGLLVIAGILTIWSGLYYLRAAWPMLRGDAPKKPAPDGHP